MNWAIRSQASAISKKYFFVSCGSIDFDLCFFKRFAEIWIADRSRLYKFDRAVEQAFKIFCKAEILFRMFGGLHLLKFNEQIEIAFTGIEPVTGCGAEDRETADLPVLTYLNDLFQVLLDDPVHDFG